MKKSLIPIFVLLLSQQVFSQTGYDDFDIESEVNAVEGKVETKPSMAPPPPAQLQSNPQQSKPQSSSNRPVSKSTRGNVEEELREQDKIVERKLRDEGQISNDRNVDRYPKHEPIFVKPPGPKQGGSVRVEHPRAAEGLIRINRDGSYQYKTPMKEKSQSGSFKLGMMTPPKVTGAGAPDLSYESMYGSDDIFSFEFDYIWQPFRGFGALGLRLGSGFATADGEGFFKTPRAGNVNRAQESYTLFIVPLSAFLEYRFEYMRNQWIVPFIAGGGTYYGLAELRDDGQGPTFAGSPTVGGGGGLLFSISRLDQAGAFTLSQEYGIADMWFVLEARAMQGLNEDLDFTNQSISAGISVDF